MSAHAATKVKAEVQVVKDKAQAIVDGIAVSSVFQQHVTSLLYQFSSSVSVLLH